MLTLLSLHFEDCWNVLFFCLWGKNIEIEIDLQLYKKGIRIFKNGSNIYRTGILEIWSINTFRLIYRWPFICTFGNFKRLSIAILFIAICFRNWRRGKFNIEGNIFIDVYINTLSIFEADLCFNRWLPPDEFKVGIWGGHVSKLCLHLHSP